MPHLTLEYTADLPPEIASRELFGRLHRVLADAGGIDIANCKSRAVGRDVFLAGDGTGEESYVHLDVRILEGRAPEAKTAMGQGVLDAVRHAYAAAGRPVQVTVEVRDMASDQYFKHAGETPPRPSP
jgi:5-carboxymethyl-2-hydroxymuconate isomerase